MTGVEMFLLPDGEVLVNELAPRPHNSGHYTIEACETSQFENHLRGVLDLPLGEVAMRAPAAAMVNLLGTTTGDARPAVAAALAVPGAHLHLYDKAEVRPGRKMGHVTALGDTAEEALAHGPPRRRRGGAVSPDPRPPLVGVVMGSDSDLPVMGGAGATCSPSSGFPTRCAWCRRTAPRTT